jgi:methylenetetrahydrofolate dehydrogenase (NADP+)/methenyltetrahydrofolate cyclohydrolase
MAARILDGTAVAGAIRGDLVPRVTVFAERHGRPPGLGIVLAGEDPASEIYVRNKLKAAAEVGIRAVLERLPATATLDDALDVVRRLNAWDAMDGMIVQSPLPDAMGADAEARIVEIMAPEKDVDGFTSVNVGRLVQNRPGLASCTPAGIIELLDRSGIPIAGSHAVVIGRSDIVGKPMALLLLHRHATVTICHSKTRNLAAVAATADLLIAAMGRPAFVTTDFVKAGATVVDVGTTRVTDEALVRSWFPAGSPRLAVFARNGALVVGDVHPGVAEVAGALTPVPGGVGPLTVAMLLSNTVRAAEMRGAR